MLTAPAADPDPPPPFPTIPLVRLGLLLLATFGVYSFVWFWRAGRVSNQRGYGGPHPAWWSVAGWIAIIGPVALFRLGERAVAAGNDRGRHVPNLATAAAALAIVAGVLSNDGVTPLMSAGLVFFVPSLLVQHQFNRAAPDHPPKPMGRPALVATVLCAGAVALLTGWTDAEYLRGYLGEQTSSGQQIAGPGYHLQPGPGWALVEPGTYGDDSDFELQAVGTDGFVVTYTHDATLGLDDVVDYRKQLVMEEDAGIRVRERRTYLKTDPKQGDFVSSIARYETDDVFGSEVMMVHTISGPGLVVEIVGWTNDLERNERMVERAIKSLGLAHK
jgi:hypothetical protein